MSPIVRWLLGLHGDGSGTWSQAKLGLAGLPIGVAAALLAIVACWTLGHYWFDGRRPSWWVKGPLVAMRVLAAACLLLILLEPVLTWSRTTRQEPAFIILADTSESMAARDPRLPGRLANSMAEATGLDPRTTPRWRLASAMLAGSAPPKVAERVEAPVAQALAALAKRCDLRVYSFSDEAHAIEIGKPARRGRDPLEPPVTGFGSTEIGSAIRAVLDDNSGRPVAGILLVSDGGHNLGDDPIAWARRARALGVPISAIGVGDPTPTRDLVVTEALADRVVRKGNEVRVFVGLRHRGHAGASATVSLARNGSVIASKSVTLAADGAKQTVPFVFTPRQVGEFRLTASAARLAGETTYANNSRTFLQQVVDKKLRVLYVEGEPRWEYRYLRNAIMRDEQIGFACFRTETSEAPEPEGNLPVAAFPDDERELFGYDIVMLGDVPRSRFRSTQLRALRRFVEDRGGSLCVIAGERHTPHEYAGTLIEPAFPLAVGAAPDPVVTDEPFQWSRTPAGAQDALLRMAADPAQDERVWRDLPGMLWMAGSQRTKPGATILAVYAQRVGPSGPRPIVALQPYGAGRCLMVMTDSTWRWRWRVGDRHFYRFWGQVLRTLTPHDNPGGNRFAQITVDRADYRSGDKVNITARLLDEFYRPSSFPQVTATLVGPTAAADRDGASGPAASRTIGLRPSPGSPGLYVADTIAGRSGEYRLTLPPMGPARTASYARFIVEHVALEAQQPEMHEETLRRIAGESGGKLLRPGEVAAWMASVRPKPLLGRATVETALWNAPIGLIVALTLLAGEWLIRRRTGMA